jgi:MFS transporter, DHA2 family, multidrug resistance protein
MSRFVQGMTDRYAMQPGGAEIGHQAALEQLWHLAYREASTLAFADAFRTIMLAFIGATLLVPFLRKVAAPKITPADAH